MLIQIEPYGFILNNPNLLKSIELILNFIPLFQSVKSDVYRMKKKKYMHEIKKNVYLWSRELFESIAPQYNDDCEPAIPLRRGQGEELDIVTKSIFISCYLNASMFLYCETLNTLPLPPPKGIAVARFQK